MFLDLTALKSEIMLEFWTWEQSSPETRRNFGLENSQVRKHVGISDLMGVNSENTSEFRTWGRSSAEFQHVFGLDYDQVRKHVALPGFRMQEVQIPNNFVFQTFFEEYKAIQVLQQHSMKI